MVADGPARSDFRETVCVEAPDPGSLAEPRPRGAEIRCLAVAAGPPNPPPFEPRYAPVRPKCLAT